jgi:hypothetical protein
MIRRCCSDGLRPVSAAVCLLLLTMLAAPPALARQAGEELGRGVGVFIPVDHWSADAARRLHALGLVPADFDPGLRSRSVAEWRRILEIAAARAVGDSGAAALVAAYAQRYSSEFRTTAPAAGRRGDVVALAASTGIVVNAGHVRAGVGFLDGDWTGVRAVPDVRTPEARFYAGGALAERVAAAVDVAVREPGIAVEEAYIAAGWRALGIWAGRRAPGYGTGAGGALVLSGDVPFTGVGGQLNHGQLLPGFLRVLGPVRLEGFVARADNMHKEPGSVDEPFRPFFGAARIAGSPVHRRFTLAASRGAMFGGEGNEPVTFRNLVRMFVGTHGGEVGDFHHEVFAVDATYRPPLGELPLLLRIEWAMDDASGMYHRAPAMTWAIELGALPGLPMVGFGFERTLFSGCFDCKNTLWYRNWYFREGWTDGGQLLGHPLGGHGREHRLHASVEVPRAQLGFDAEIRHRQRREENLLVPQRRGSSALVGGRIRWRGVQRTFIDLDLRREHGALGWAETSFVARAGYRF